MAVTSERRYAGSRAPREARREDRPRRASRPVAGVVAPLFELLFPDGPPLRFVFWDGSALGPGNELGTVHFRSPDVLKRMLWSPNELGIARAYVVGEIEIEGDLFKALKCLHDNAASTRRIGGRALAAGAVAALRLGALGLPPKRPLEEIRLSGWRHSKRRDSAAIKHHYDVGDDFYRLVLGPTMTYSCARFEPGETSLEAAQTSKHDMICRKLGLDEEPGARLLEVGCGWGSMAAHAAETYKADVVAITLSPSQASAARCRLGGAGACGAGNVDVRLQDYRDLDGETFDAISSVGMFEHVGSKQMDQYFRKLFSLLRPEGRLLNHAISKPGGSKMRGQMFINRYVFPDGELIDVAEVVRAMERAGFEVRDVESLREHYALTLRSWVANLEGAWDEAVRLVGEARARVWRLYMSASANGFEDGGLAVHQVLGVRPSAGGSSGMPPTRAGWS